jgi:hypothetical protein
MPGFWGHYSGRCTDRILTAIFLSLISKAQVQTLEMGHMSAFHGPNKFTNRASAVHTRIY